MGRSFAIILWWFASRTSSVDPSQPLPSQLRKMARNKNHCGAPASDCAFLGPPAKYTGRYAVFMAGRVRVAHLALQKAKALIARRYAGKIRVDWYAHLWYNESSLCERRALEELTAIATAITTEPVACMWSWGETGFVNQWHGVDGAFQTLLRFGRLDDYTLVLKTRVDVAYDDLDFEALWARYGASASANASGGHFMVLGASSGWDVHMVGTPPLARVMAGYGLRSGYACDSSMDSFPWQRMRRYGCWPPVADAAQDPLLRGAPLADTLRVMCRDTAGAAPRCAPLFVDHFPSVIKRPIALAINPDTEPRLGCAGRRLGGADAPRRRLPASRGPNWAMPESRFCDAHRHDVYYVSPNATLRHRGDQGRAAPRATCPPDCAPEPPADEAHLLQAARQSADRRAGLLAALSTPESRAPHRR